MQARNSFLNLKGFSGFSLMMLILVLSGCRQCIHDGTNGAPPQDFKKGTGGGVPITGVTGKHAYHVANISVCGGYTVYHTDATITWGDGNAWSGWVAGGPGGALLSENSYTSPGVYPVHATVNAVCTNNNSPDWSDSAVVDTTAFIFAAPVVVQSLTFTPPTIKVGQASTLTVVVSPAAPAGGMQVTFMSPNASSLQGLPLSGRVPTASTTVTPKPKVKALAAGDISVYVTSGDGSATVSTTLHVQ